MGRLKLQISEQQYKRTELKVSYINKELPSKNSAVKERRYLKARYYNPRESVWLSVDPLAEKYPNMSPYAYTFNNPIKFVDPTGLKPFDWVRRTYMSGWEYYSNIKSEAQARALGFAFYANGRGDSNSTYDTSLSLNGLDTHVTKTITLRENGYWTSSINGKIVDRGIAPDNYVDMSMIDDFEKFMAGITISPLLVETIPYLLSTEGILMKGSVSLTGQVIVNKNLDIVDFGADMFTVPGISGIIGGAYDFNILPDQNGQHFFNNLGDYKKIGVSAATSLISGGLGNRFSPAINTIQSKATKNAATYMIETNYNIMEQGLNKAYEKKQKN